MADRQDNSVLFSLKELQRIEADRLRQEEAAVRAREEAVVRAREDEERRAREQIERARREQEEAVLRRQEERIRAEREEQLRLEEAERRARVEAQARIDAERMRLQMQAQIAHQPHKQLVRFLGAGVVGLLVLAVGLGVFLHEKNLEHQRKQQALQESIEKYEHEIAQSRVEAQQLAAEKRRLDQQLGVVHNEAQRQELIRRKEAVARRESENRERARKAAEEQERKRSLLPAGVKGGGKRKGPASEDPLGDLKL
jgi:hypothetical protein